METSVFWKSPMPNASPMPRTRPETIAERLKALPKAEVHVHLEGSFEAGLLATWAGEAGIALPRPCERLFEFSGLEDFLAFLDWSCRLTDSAGRVHDLAYAFAQRLDRDGTAYADLIFNPAHWSPWHGRLRQLLGALHEGFSAAEQDGLPQVGLCVSLLRSQSADQAIELVDCLVQWRHPRVVALSVDGNEAAAGRTGPRFAEAFRRAGRAGIKRTVHAGESSGAEGVRDAVELLGADRIDHGIRAVEDPAVVALLADRAIPLGICPTSNVSLKVVAALAEHPIERLRRAGVPVSINTDDPGLLDTTLPREYAICRAQFGWSDAVVAELAGNAIAASFAPVELKARLLTDLALW